MSDSSLRDWWEELLQIHEFAHYHDYAEDLTRREVDFLAQARQHIWQVLPLCPTGYGNSPYAGSSAFAGNPYLISLKRNGPRKPSLPCRQNQQTTLSATRRNWRLWSRSQ